MAKITNKALPNDPSMFPPPVTWMSWVADSKVKRDAAGNYVTKTMSNGYQQYVYESGPDGKVRYHFNYADTRKSLMWNGRKSKYRAEDESGTFYSDWAVYEWENGEWVLRGQGFKGEKRDDNTFFNTKLTPKDREHPFDRAVEDKAIESILQAVSRAS